MKRICAFLAAVILLFGAGCGKPKTETAGDVTDTHTTVLTGVYRGTELTLPRTLSIEIPGSNYETQVDSTLGVMTVLGWKDDGSAALLHVSPDAGTIGEAILSAPLPEGYVFIGCSFFGGECYILSARYESVNSDDYILGRSYIRGANLRRFSTEDGTLLGEREILPLFTTYEGHEYDFILYSLVITEDGTVWVKTSAELLLLTAELEKVSSITTSVNSGFLAAAPDNRVWLFNHTGASIYAKSSQIPEKVLRDLPDEVSAARFAPSEETVLYVQTPLGVWKYVPGEENQEAACELLMNYANSNVHAAHLTGAFGDDAFVLSESVDGEPRLMLYRRSDDVDLSLIDTIEIAAAFDPSKGQSAPTDLIVEYNKAHPETMLVLRDYSIYNTSENPNGGQNRLLTDIVTGIYRPDIVISDTVDPIRQTGGAVADVLVKKDFCADLMPYLTGDSDLDPDNLFGAVKRLFRMENGGMWGIADTFQTYTLVGSGSVLGQYADGWTLGEFLDFAEGWTSPLLLCQFINREQIFSWTLGPNALESFIDRENAVCSFDSPDFERFLRFYMSLPATADDWYRSAPFKIYTPQAYDYLHTGKVAFNRTFYYQLSDITNPESTFGTKDWVSPGFPGTEGHGSPAYCQKAYMLLKTSKKPDLAAEIIRELVREAHSYGVPSMKSRYDELAPKELTHFAIQYYDGSVIAGSLNDNDPRTKPLKRAGYICVPEEDDLARFREFLDTKAGYPMTEFVDPEIQAIVAEELSAFGAGVGTPADCAAKIQSRVSIWLAEHH